MISAGIAPPAGLRTEHVGDEANFHGMTYPNTRSRRLTVERAAYGHHLIPLWLAYTRMERRCVLIAAGRARKLRE